MKRPVLIWIFILAGLGVLAVAFGTYFHTRNFLSVAQRATGSVIEMRELRDRDSMSSTYAPTFTFQDASGTLHTNLSRFSSSPPAFRIGDTVQVLYRSDDPQTARIDSYFQIWGIPTVTCGIGIIMIMLGVVVHQWPKLTSQSPSGILAVAVLSLILCGYGSNSNQRRLDSLDTAESYEK